MTDSTILGSPLLFARHIANGPWYAVPHIALISQKIVSAINRKGPNRIIITMPPRHGKSDFTSGKIPAWFLGNNPNKQAMLTSYEADFASQWGRKNRDVLDQHGHLFGIRVNQDSRAANRWGIMGHDGGMQTAGVGGPLTGKGAHLLICDDPIKNAEEAQSKVYRDKMWDWWLSTAYSRLEPGGVAVIIQTRWNEDDLAGRLIEQMEHGGERWEVLNLPALAEENDPLGREVGEALWPERYNVAELEKIRKALGDYWWSALYQQRPAPREGGMFRRDWFEVLPARPETRNQIRFWDLASTDGGGDWTVGTLIGRDNDKNVIVLDVIRGQWGPHQRDKIIRQTAELDGKDVKIRIEQEPGSSGVSVIHQMTRMLQGFRVRGIRSTGDKVSRADVVSSQAGIGIVKIVRAAWNRDWLEELTVFPNGKHDDQVDSLSGSFIELTLKTRTIMVS